MLKNYRFTFLWAGWIACITFLSLLSFSPEQDMGSIAIPHADKIVHFIFYLLFSVSGCFCVREQTQGKSSLASTVAGILPVAIAYGAGIEGIQALTGYRTATFGDVLANTAGALAGVGLVWWIFASGNALKWHGGAFVKDECLLSTKKKA